MQNKKNLTSTRSGSSGGRGVGKLPMQPFSGVGGRRDYLELPPYSHKVRLKRTHQGINLYPTRLSFYQGTRVKENFFPPTTRGPCRTLSERGPGRKNGNKKSQSSRHVFRPRKKAPADAR